MGVSREGAEDIMHTETLESVNSKKMLWGKQTEWPIFGQLSPTVKTVGLSKK